MASQWIFLGLNAGPAKLKTPLYPGSSIYFVSPTFDGEPDKKPHLDNTAVNLENGKDVLLQISIRRVENRIVFDTRRGETWDRNYQVIDLKSAFPGPGAIIRVDSHASSYDVSFNNSPKIHTFPKRINANATAVSYVGNEERSVFSDPIIAEVFDNGVFISPSISS